MSLEMNKQTYLYTFLIVFFVKISFLLLFQYFSPEGISQSLSFYNYTGDTNSYLAPMQNYIAEDTYLVEKSNIKYYSIRPPHYTIIYLFLQKIGLENNASFNVIVLIQVIVNSLSVIALSILAMKISKHKIAFYLTFILLTLSSSMSYLNSFLAPESLAISFVSISLFLIYKFYESKNSKYLFFASILIALSVQLRPYILLILILPFIYSLITFFRDKHSFNFLRNIFLSGFAMMIIFLPWTYRNYKIYNTFAPYDYKILDFYYDGNYDISTTKAKRNLLVAVGESDVFWDIKSMSSFFENDSSRFKTESLFNFNSYYFSKSITQQDYNKARTLYIESLDSVYDIKDINSIKYFNHLAYQYKKEKPVNYYIISKIRLVSDMVFHNSTYFFPFTFNQDSSFAILLKLWKLSEFALYKLILVFSFLGAIICVLKKKHEALFILLPLSVLITTSLLGHAEYRYFTLSYPILFIFAIYGLITITNIRYKR